MAKQAEYVLGTDRIELERLKFQHGVWLDQARGLWSRAGFDRLGEERGSEPSGHGARLADLGSGPGYTSLDLAAFAGSRTEVLAVDESERFVAELERLAARAGARITPLVARVEQLDLPAGSLDGAYARWLFCWLKDPTAAVRKVARALRPGARLALQEYLHWGTFALLPRAPALDAAVRACLASWAGVHIDLAALAPRLAADAGLELEHMEPIARMGAPGEPVWEWLETFHRSYLPRLVERGLLGADECAAALQAWRDHGELPGARVLAPTMASVILRKPL